MSAKTSKAKRLCDHRPFPWVKPAPEEQVPCWPPAGFIERDQLPFAWLKPAQEDLAGRYLPARDASAVERDRRTNATGRYTKLAYELPDNALRQVAEEFAFHALQLVRRADELDARERQWEASVAKVASLPALAEPVYQQIQQGKTPEEAIKAVALETESPVETVAFAWKRRVTLNAKIARAKRNREILSMFKQGWTKVTIAKRVGMSLSWIKTIVKRQLAAEQTEFDIVASEEPTVDRKRLAQVIAVWLHQACIVADYMRRRGCPEAATELEAIAELAGLEYARDLGHGVLRFAVDDVLRQLYEGMKAHEDSLAGASIDELGG